MKLFLLFAIAVIAKSQNNHGCKTSCDCPDFTDYFSVTGATEHVYTKINDCVFNATCLEGHQAGLRILWQYSEIEMPSTTSTSYFGIDVDGTPMPIVDFFTTFGIVCENGFWIATKYPNGIGYLDSETGATYLGSPEEYDGKKSRVYRALWSLKSIS